MLDCPCATCYPPDRTIRCHTYCEKYIAWSKQEKEKNEKKRRDKERYNTLSESAVRSIWKKMGGK